MRKILVLLTIFFCGLQAKSQTDTSGRSIYRHTPAKHTELKHTKLKVSFNFDNQTMNGEEWLTASPYFYPTDSLLLDAKAMLIHEVSSEKNGEKKPLRFLYQNDSLSIELDRTYRSDEEYTVYIRYTAQPEQVTDRGKRTFSDTKGLYFINPKGEEPEVPTQIWTQGETEYASCWFPTIDKPNQKSTQEIYITVPDKYATLSNGLLEASEQNNDHTRTDHWVMRDKHAPYLFFMAAGEFAIVKDTPWRGKVPVEYYVEKGHEPMAKQVFGATREMIEFYSRKFRYDFPWQKYSQIVLRDFIAGGMENTTAVSHAESAMQTPDVLADKNHWEIVIAHEAAHHWFGNLVTAESWSNLVVNEAFANYAEYLWVEHKYGIDDADFHLIQKAREYHSHPADFSKQAVRFGYEDKEEMFDKVSYNKGGMILHMLRDYLGDEAFFEGIGCFLRQHEFGTAEVHDIRRAFEKVSGKDLNWFFNQWFFGHGHPVVETTTRYDEESRTLAVCIVQKQDSSALFEFPLEIDVYEGGNYQRHKVWVEAKEENVFTFATGKKPDLTDINPRGVILMKELAEKTKEEYLFQYRNASSLKSRYQAVSFAAKNKSKAILLSAANDPCHRIRIKALSDLPADVLSRSELSAIADIVKTDPNNLVKSAGMWTLASTHDKRYLPLFEQALAICSASVRNAALNGIAKINPEKAKNFLLQSDPKDLTSDQISELAPVIVRHRMAKYLEQLMGRLIYYPFVEKENPKQAAVFREGYIWAMSLDKTILVEKAVHPFREMQPYLNDDETTRNFILKVLGDGLKIKKRLPETPSVREQIRLISETIECIK